MQRIEKFINDWNGEFPDYPLTANDLKKPHAVMGALFQIFDSLGIDREAITKPPPEESRTENMIYYADFIPIINMIRVFNHLVSVMPQVCPSISVTHFLQPTLQSTQFMLLLLLNVMAFNKQLLRDIAPHEEQLFAKTNEVKLLEAEKQKLLNMVNEQARDKGKIAARIEKINLEIKIFDEELQQENEGYAEDKLELEAVENENRQIHTILDQKKTQEDALLEEIEKKKVLRVYDAEDVKAQAEQAARNVQEAEEELKNLKETLMQKEASLKNLQTIKPNLDIANNLLYEISKITESLRDYETGDLDADSKEGELEVLQIELSDLQGQLAELKIAREEESEKRRQICDKRQQEGALLISTLQEAEENDKRCCGQSARSLQRIEEIKESISKYEQEKVDGLEEINKMKNFFTNELKSVENILLKKAKESKKRIESKLKNRNL